MSVNIAEGKANDVPHAKIAVAVSRWNSVITDKMLEGALQTLRSNGIKEENIAVVRCPGAFELPLTVQWLLENEKPAGVVALGAVIRGGTPHFEYVCDAVTGGISALNLKHNIPVAFGVLTTDNIQQAMDRVSDQGNKGSEAALALLEMISLHAKIKGK